LNKRQCVRASDADRFPRRLGIPRLQVLEGRRQRQPGFQPQFSRLAALRHAGDHGCGLSTGKYSLTGGVAQRARQFWSLVERQRDLLPYRYAYQIGDGKKHGGRGSGQISGIDINGKKHSLHAGPGVCFLEHRVQGPDGPWHVESMIDIRGQSRIETDDDGPIKIYRRKSDLTLFETVPALVSFFTESKDETFRVLTTESTPPLMTLVRAAAQGNGADDWAVGELAARGDTARDELIAKLQESRPKKHYPTIAFLLLTVFPSAESRRAVEDLFERDKDEERRRMYALWLSTADRLAGVSKTQPRQNPLDA
jgi:hypothetical protein